MLVLNVDNLVDVIFFKVLGLWTGLRDVLYYYWTRTYKGNLQSMSTQNHNLKSIGTVNLDNL